MHVCKAIRHKKQHFTFLTATGKEEKPDVGLSCPAGSQCGPISPGITPQKDEHQGENLQAQILENTEAVSFAWDTRHLFLQHRYPQKSPSVHWLVKT